MASDSTTPRREAARMIDLVLNEGRLLAELLPELAGRLDPAERARAGRLATATLRHLGRADAVLAPHLRKTPPPTVHNLLRMATVEILGEGAAPHGVVNDVVNLVRRHRKLGHMAGLANAVLRKVAETPSEQWAALPPQKLPGWLTRALRGAWGRKAVVAIEAAHAAGAPLDLTPKDDAAAQALADALGAELLPTGSVRLAGARQVSDLPGFADGAWRVQDAAAALPARWLAPAPGARVLDLCAAPGGKTLQLAAAGTEVTALDISEARLARLRENMARTGLAAQVVAADALDWVPDAPFDAILLDAPCSATGTIRRHPDLPFAKAEMDLGPLTELQDRLFDKAVGWLKPGGRLVFCTCSLLPEEGEARAASALSRHPELRPAPRPAAAADWPGSWDDGIGLRLRPDMLADRGGIDGFYIAAFDHAD